MDDRTGLGRSAGVLREPGVRPPVSAGAGDGLPSFPNTLRTFCSYGDSETPVPMGTRQKPTMTSMGYAEIRTARTLVRYFCSTGFEDSVV